MYPSTLNSCPQCVKTFIAPDILYQTLLFWLTFKGQVLADLGQGQCHHHQREQGVQIVPDQGNLIGHIQGRVQDLLQGHAQDHDLDLGQDLGHGQGIR